MHDVLPGEDGLTAQDLGEDAPDAPDVNRRRVLGEERPAQLGRAVPSRGDVIGPENGGRPAVVERGPRQSEVADLELAVRVGEDVLGLQVAVIHVRGVHVLEPAQKLVEEKLVVFLSEIVVRLDHLVEIRLHELEDDEDVLELARVRGEHDVFHLDDVRVLQHAQELHLAQDPGRIGDVLEDVRDFLDRDALARFVVRRRAHHAVAPLADDLVDGEPVRLAARVEERLLVPRVVAHRARRKRDRWIRRPTRSRDKPETRNRVFSSTTHDRGAPTRGSVRARRSGTARAVPPRPCARGRSR
mmetsp:Transcript_8321/g.35290  ORF Transcript_8321/g.35290 Transcript_8321/m.35290 type:complete len:300 (-) Transcript_8321:27-926(-)